MPNTVEHRVECHRLARERLAANKPVWDRTIRIKHVIAENREDTSEENCAAVANRIGAILRSRVPASWLDASSDDADYALIEVVEGMEAVRPDSYDDDPSFSVHEDLSNMLEQMYDWGDMKRVWFD